MASEGLLGQSTILEFVQIDDAPPALLAVDRTPYPLVPTAPARVGGPEEGVDGLVERISSLPIEELMTSAIGALDSVQSLAGNPEIQALPASVNGLIADTRDVVGSDDILAALADFQASAADLRALSDEIRNSPGLASLLTALESSEEITGGLTEFSNRLPGVIDDVEAITGEVRAIPLADLVASVDRVTGQLETLLASDGVEALPDAIRGTLGELQATLGALREGGAVENLNQTLTAARSALAAIETASAQVPDVVSRLDQVARTLQGAVGGYAPGSRIHSDLTTAIRDISEAADAFRSLARSIERNPNALITGR